MLNAKTQRPGVCNAAETLLVHERAAEEFLPRVLSALARSRRLVRADERSPPSHRRPRRDRPI